MTDQERKQSEELLRDMKNSMGTVFKKGSDLYREMINAFEQFLDAGKKPVNPKNTYQFVSRADRLENYVKRYEEKNKGAITISGQERLGYANQIKTLLSDNKYDELRNPNVAKKFEGRSFQSLQKSELMPELHPVTIQNPEMKVPVVVDYEGEKRWFTPVSQGGNKNIAAARLGALLGIQEAAGGSSKSVLHFDNKMVEGSLQTSKNGEYTQDIPRRAGLSYEDSRFQKAISDLTLLRFITGADPKASDSLIVKSELSNEPSTSRTPARIKLTGIQESSHVSGFDPSKKGMEAGEIRTMSKSVAANLLVITPEMVEFTLKDVLSKEQIKQVNENLSKAKRRVIDIPVVEDGAWGEKERKLNSWSPVYAGIVQNLGPERRASVSSNAESEKKTANTLPQTRSMHEEAATLSPQEKTPTSKAYREIPPAPPLPGKIPPAPPLPGKIPPAPPLPEKGITQAQISPRIQIPPKTQTPPEKDKLMAELEDRLKRLEKPEERKSALKKETQAQPENLISPVGQAQKKVTFKELIAAENPKIRIRTQEARKQEELKKKPLGTHL